MSAVTTVHGLWRRLCGEAARFGAVGAAAFVLDLGAYNLASLVIGLGPLTSKALAVLVAATFAYVANRVWTFAERGGRREQIGVAGEYGLFFLLNAIGLLIALACLGIAYYGMGLTSAFDQNVSGNGVGLVLGTAFRFWAYRRWVFPDRDEEAEPDEEPAPAALDRAA